MGPAMSGRSLSRWFARIRSKDSAVNGRSPALPLVKDVPGTLAAPGALTI
jgi:hypothetical protein